MLKIIIAGGAGLLSLVAFAQPLPHPYSDIKLESLGPKPQYDRALCAEVTQGVTAWQPKSDDEKAVKKLSDTTSLPQFNRLLSLMGNEVMWWLRIGNVFDIVALSTAFHETNHIIDEQLRVCNGNKATYFFDGAAYQTEIDQGTLPPYAIASKNVPLTVKNKPSGRYQVYFDKRHAMPGNDLAILVDELNAYVTGAQLEIALAGGDLYNEAVRSGKYESYDGHIQGAADFMLYFLAYMKSVREDFPDVYQKIRNSPQFIAYVQRLWNAAEKILTSAQRYAPANGGIYYTNPEVIDFIYAENYIAELDKLGIQHGSKIKLVPTGK